ncbi:MAG: TraR/DksA family transcriptional regulator [Nocardioidaceae bacterium]
MTESDARPVLERSRERLTAQLAALTARPEPGAGIGFGKRVGDSTSMAVERITDVAAQESLMSKLAETERAIAKLDEGSYGLCDVCGDEIGAERLEFRPSATRCVKHAS